MHISVRFFTSLREIIEKKEEELTFSKAETVTIRSVFEHLVRIHGKKFAEYLYDGKTGEVKGYLQLLVNGRNVSSSGGPDTKLCDGDILAIIPPVGGG